MKRSMLPLTGALLLLAAASAHAQPYPLMDQAAQKVIQKYQTTSCADLSKQRSQSKGQSSPAEQRFMAMLRSDPRMRAAFLNQVAAPIANRMFECGMIP